MSAWKAYLVESRDGFIRNRITLQLEREAAGGVEVILRDGRSHLAVYGGPNESHDLEFGSLIPTDALEAIRDAIDARLGRRYDEALVFELRQTLERERTRVDELTERLSDLVPTHVLEDVLEKALRP